MDKSKWMDKRQKIFERFKKSKYPSFKRPPSTVNCTLNPILRYRLEEIMLYYGFRNASEAVIWSIIHCSEQIETSRIESKKVIE